MENLIQHHVHMLVYVRFSVSPISRDRESDMLKYDYKGTFKISCSIVFYFCFSPIGMAAHGGISDNLLFKLAEDIETSADGGIGTNTRIQGRRNQ